MPIICNRKTGEVKSSIKLTPEQNSSAWETILREYIKKHPQVLEDKQ